MVIMLFFFFKQKTAYEMRISDWSSDVCSSDLIGGAISVVTRKPTDDFSVMGQVSGGRFNRIDVGGVINIPIVEGKLKSSIAFSSKNRNAWQKRIPFPGAAGFASDPSEAFQQIDYTSRTAA